MSRTRSSSLRSERTLRLPALEIRQGEDRKVYTFAIEGKLIPRIATVSRARRSAGTQLSGYQRPQVLAHVAAIRRYLDSDERPMLPNSIVVAFDERVRFTPAKVSPTDPPYVRYGELVIPFTDESDETDRPGYIVDGQQRCAAIQESKLETFPIFVTAFIAAEPGDQRTQFILVNSAKALPKGLIHELLPGTSGTLPVALMVRQLPASVVERLNFDPASPLYKMIQTPTNPTGVIKDTSMIKVIETSMSDGALYHLRVDNSTAQIEPMTAVVSDFWAAVSRVFPNAWNRPPRLSRLMHGAGIISMGHLMDEITRGWPVGSFPTTEEFEAEIRVIADECRWTDGEWVFDADTVRQWNHIQNTPRDVQRLTDHLLRLYRSRRLARARQSGRAPRQRGTAGARRAASSSRR